MNRPRCIAAAGITVLLCTGAHAQPRGPQQPDMKIDADTRTRTIDAAIASINKTYIFPDAAKKMEAAIHERVSRKEYDKLDSAQEFARALTANLQEVSHDKHLRVAYRAEVIGPDRDPDAKPTAEDIAQQKEETEWMNGGFRRAERLKGNVGYIKFDGFQSPEFAADAATAAMNFVASTNALIFDIRDNGGGEPAMVALISSYLFGPEPVHLNDLYFRKDDSTHQWWTLPHVPGRRFGAVKPVYVLTSGYTFSAAEEFAYNLQNLKRATIVGETTGGGAHPGDFHRLGDHFGIFVPEGRAINPVSKTNWEGTGVKPDIAVPADEALHTAHLMAVKSCLESIKVPQQLEMLREVRQELEADGKVVDIKTE